MTKPIIPAEAVDAAAEALAKADLRGGFSKDDYADALTALEAAAPHIIQAWINETTRLPSQAPDYGAKGRVRGPIYPLGKIEDKRR